MVMLNCWQMEQAGVCVCVCHLRGNNMIVSSGDKEGNWGLRWCSLEWVHNWKKLRVEQKGLPVFFSFPFSCVCVCGYGCVRGHGRVCVCVCACEKTGKKFSPRDVLILLLWSTSSIIVGRHALWEGEQVAAAKWVVTVRSNISKGSKNKETPSGKSTPSPYDWLKFALHGIGLASTTPDPTKWTAALAATFHKLTTTIL